MQEQVVYVRASDSNPNTTEIDDICRKMADDGFALLHVSPSQTEGGATVGLWLFFSDFTEVLNAAETVPHADVRGLANLMSVHQGDAASIDPAMQTPAYWWSEIRAKKGLGLSLTLTGVMAMIIGSLLHFALQNNLIDTTLHLGYFFGLVGLILFLIGLVILF